MFISIRSRLLLTVLTVTSMTGCVSALHEPELNPPTSQHDYRHTLSDSQLAQERWWRAFGSNELDQLVEEALQANLDLQVAALRIEQLYKVKDQMSSGLIPTFTGAASAGRSRSQTGMPTGPVTSNQFSASVAVAYELDLWGRTRASIDAADLDAQAARESAEALAMTISAQVTEAWLDLIAQRQRRELLLQQISTADAFYELTLMRLQIGAATALDVLQQEQQVQSLKAQLPVIDAAEDRALNTLALLLSKEPGQIGVDTQPPLPELPQAAPGLPADLLQQRPDLRAAELQARAADARLVVAIADRLPSVKLSLSFSTAASSPSDLFEELFWSAVAQASAPLFDGFRTANAHERAELVVDEKLLLWKKSFLAAIHEVEGALLNEALQTELINTQNAQLDTARQTPRAGAPAVPQRSQRLLPRPLCLERRSAARARPR